MWIGVSTTISISIHAPREGGDTSTLSGTRSQVRFQSTPPARGATRGTGKTFGALRISIHAPREGGDGTAAGAAGAAGISIHAPREGGDRNDVRLDIAS